MKNMNFCKCGAKSGELEFGEKNSNINEEQKEDNTFVRKLKSYVLEFCKEGSLHGVKYLGENRTFIEKLWWIISMVISLYFCIALVLSAYRKWENVPVIVSFATKETPIWQIPFPTVTICPETKALPSKYNFSHYLQMKKKNKVLTKDEDTKFGYMSLICSYHHDVNYSSIEDKHTETEELFDFFDEVQPDFFKMISDCRYMGVAENCSDLFFPIISDEGICYTFNLLDRSQLLRGDVIHYKNYHRASALSNWTLEHGYPSSDGTITYPRRALFAGATFDLEAKFSIDENELEYSCGSPIQGFKIQIPHPSKIPRVKQQHFRIPLDTAIIAAISPDIATTSKAVKKYDPKKRNCYFPSERHLKYFRLYTQQNCQIECKTNYTIDKCGCTHFYMPKTNGTKICTGGKLDCIYESENQLLISGIDKKIEMLREGKKPEERSDECDCLPICTSMNYVVENSESVWNWRKYYNEKGENKHMSYIQIFFKGNQFITLDRSELFGATDFLANVGGLLGLFIGFSLLSIVEIIYYCSLRIICNIKMFGRENWSGKHD